MLGIATISGTFVLTDSITHAFDTIFSSIYVGTDASITGKSAVSVDATQDLPPFDESLLPKVKQLPQVQAAIGGVAGIANLIGQNGKVISFGGAPHLGFSVDPSQAKFNSLTLVEGEWPSNGEVVIDRSTARKKHIEVGDQIRIEAQGAATPFKVAGLVRVRLQRARHRRRDALRIQPADRAAPVQEGGQARPDPSLEEGRTSARPRCSPRSGRSSRRRPRCGAASSRRDTDASDTNAFTSFLQTFLLSFGFIALFVGAFVIANSLSITIAQRTREFATLRTIGASRRQILRSVLLESFIIGIARVRDGLFLGLGLAKLLFWIFEQCGLHAPEHRPALQASNGDRLADRRDRW